MHTIGTLSMLMVLVALMVPDYTAAMLSRRYKVFRLRQFLDLKCTQPNIPSSTIYASTDGSCFCDHTDMWWSQSDRDRGRCYASSGVVVGNTYNVTIGHSNTCWKEDPENYYISGILEVCVTMQYNFSTFADVTIIYEPIYIWQLLLLVLGCTVAVYCIGVAVYMRRKRYRRYKDTHDLICIYSHRVHMHLFET
jgi:hypothetical protein